MAQDGDTITYTYNGEVGPNDSPVPQNEDVSAVDQATVEYCDGPGGASSIGGGSGGTVENAIIDLTNETTLYIFVGGSKDYGRYRGASDIAGGSTEIALTSTDSGDGTDENFLVGAGGGGSKYAEFMGTPFVGGGARGGQSAQGVAPPQGGSAPSGSGDTDSDGEGALDDANRGYITDTGTITKGGGSAPGANGEVRISYASAAPAAPSNVTVTDSSTEDELTIDWDAVSDATSYNVYRAQSSGTTTSDYTLIAQPASPPYTDAGLEDGEQYYYRITSEK